MKDIKCKINRGLGNCNLINKIGFTLIELIIVVTILAILWTIGFVSYVWYVSVSRDSTRISQIQIINQAFNSYTHWRPPLPDNKVTIYASWVILGYQWYVGEDVLSNIWVNEQWKDPLDNNYYTYFIDKKQRNIQLLTFLENELDENLSYNWFINQAIADYSNRIPKPYWSKLWVIVESGSNSPIQDNTALRDSWLDVSTTTTPYKAYFTSDQYLYWTWIILHKLQQSINHNWVWLASPSSCPGGFIGVPGNIEFNQPGFCVMKYEASYNTPYNLTTEPNRETDDYNSSKTDIISKAWGYPITKITQLEAINLCKNMWEGYHLVMNDEWMVIARNIEQVWNNWSGNKVWSWFIYIGRSENSLRWCVWSWWISDILSSTWAESTWTDCIEKRNDWKARNTLILSNWEDIWDFAGNIQEHVNKANTLDWNNYATWTNPNLCGQTNDGYEWNECTLSWRTLYWPTNIARTSTYWVWTVYGYNWTIFTRWGRASNSFRSGIFRLTLDFDSDSKIEYLGFRCAK